MTRDELEALAKKAGLAKHGPGWTAWDSQLERFAALVAAHEREACIAACNTVDLIGADECIEAIRGRT